MCWISSVEHLFDVTKQYEQDYKIMEGLMLKLCRKINSII